jgi:hypothetical protein
MKWNKTEHNGTHFSPEARVDGLLAATYNSGAFGVAPNSSLTQRAEGFAKAEEAS